jgi:uncharacterized protein YydD (DUF2326 family)
VIISISSSLATFKTITFRQGLNVLVADTGPTSGDKQTRNSAGKTSLIEIVHFLLGSRCDRDSLFRIPSLIEHSFFGTFALGGHRLSVSRSGSEPNRFYLEDEVPPDGLNVRTDKKSDRLFITLADWKIFLGHVMFRLPADPVGSAFDEPYTPSFRSMVSYFARRRSAGGFIAPERQAEKQARWDWQVNLSYLLGLDWQIPFAFHKVRERERTLDELKRAARGGALGEVVGTVAELRPKVILAEKSANRLRQQLANFQVHESYRELSNRASRAKSLLQTKAREALILDETIEHLLRALSVEAPPAKSDLERLYSAAGVELPGVTLKRLEEVAEFYNSVVQNRRVHLESDINEARTRLAEIERQVTLLDTERRDILKTLDGRGALDDFLSLQRNVASLEAEAASLRERFKAAELLEGEKTQLDIDRANLKLRLQTDHHARQQALDRAIILIADAINELYDDREGRLEVEATDNGPEFSISIEGDRGGGISNMEIFCFDLALFQIVGDRLGGPGFLIHDSHLFDGVDERQIARALSLGKSAADDQSQQYIVTMNSDIFDRLPPIENVDLSEAILPTRLSDDSETGGLFGFRFD